MANSVVTSAAVAAVIGVAAAGIAAGAMGLLTAGGTVAGKKVAHATIYLDPVGGDCVISTTPQTLEAYKKETIEWSIVDRCFAALSTDVEIEFDPPSNDPLDPGCVHKGKKKIRCTLKTTPVPDLGFYKYKVKATGAITEDPELEIVQ